MFTIAHELGHAALHILVPGFEQDSGGTERLCDLFAVELIMPFKLVRDIWRHAPGVDAIVGLAERTKGSLTASCIRVAECVGNITTGLASPDGAIEKQYGANLGRDIEIAVESASRKVHLGRPARGLYNGLDVSIHSTKSLVVFLARRLR